MEKKIEIKLKERPYSNLDRRIGRSDPECGHEAYVGIAKEGILLFGSKPCVSNGVFYPCSGYYIPLVKVRDFEDQLGRQLEPGELITVTVVW